MQSQKQWIWQDEHSGGVMGAIADFDDKIIRWFDQPGCNCDDATQQQTFADFLKRGAVYFDPPSDVIEEIQQELVQLS
jgi:hypothetical protein